MAYSAFALALLLSLAYTPATAQQTGPPAGVPVPTAPIASDNSQSPTADTAPNSNVFRIRLLDGRNGTPIGNAHLRLWYDDAGGPGYALVTNANGIALMPEPVGMPVRVLLSSEDRIECRKLPLHEPAPGYNLTAIAQKGDSTENRCGFVPVKPRPGELLFFVRPPKWYEGINRQ